MSNKFTSTKSTNNCSQITVNDHAMVSGLHLTTITPAGLKIKRLWLHQLSKTQGLFTARANFHCGADHHKESILVQPTSRMLIAPLHIPPASASVQTFFGHNAVQISFAATFVFYFVCECSSECNIVRILSRRSILKTSHRSAFYCIAAPDHR